MAGPGLNKVTLIGHLGDDPEQRRTQSGALVVNLRVATSERWVNAETRERNERTEWHRVVFFGRTAETIAEFLRKGSQVYIEGRLQTRKWQDTRTGMDRYTTEVVGRDVIFLSRVRSAPGDSYNRPADSGSSYDSSKAETPSGRAPGRSTPPTDFADDPIDDIPW